MAKISPSDAGKTIRRHAVRYASVIVFPILFSSPAVPAQETGAADPLGRLFTTIQERRALDSLRSKQSSELDPIEIREDIVLEQAPEEAPAEARNPVFLRGLMRRENGANTIWINDANTHAGDPLLEYITVSPSDTDRAKATISVLDRDKSLELKVGQTYEPLTDQVIDLADPSGESAAPR